MSKSALEIEIRADDKASQSLSAVGKAVQEIAPAAQAAGATATSSIQGLQGAGAKAAEGVQSIAEQLRLVQSAYLALQGAGQLTGMVKSAIETADSFNNLAARIRLSTGEGKAFDEAMAAVADISLRTHVPLETTGTLFARLNDTGRSAGLSAKEAMTQALSLTETINQAVQLSGASAQASDAAVTQLIQGLQGGVVRGDEFNSVMEQSPRLAKALADGLGVTTGELRKMADAGRLSADVVMGALQSQAAVLKTEFASLPPTVGRAMQDLSTAWTLYIGNADKATGATELVAKAVQSLAQNLPTVAGYLLDAGQAAAAFAALRLAQTFLGLGAAATASAAGVAATATAIGATGAAAATAAVPVGRFAALLGGLKTFTLLGLITNFKDIGTWIGESAAKLAGYTDQTKKLAEQEAMLEARQKANLERRQQQVAMDQAAQAALLGLSQRGSEAIAKFEELVKSGKSAAEAVGEIGKGFDLSASPGIRDAATVLNALLAKGKLTAQQFEQAWADALKGQDLSAFTVKAIAGLDQVADKAARLAQINDAVLTESVRRVGPAYELLAGVASTASNSAVNDTQALIDGLDRLRAKGVDVAAALTASLGQGIQTANTEAALTRVTAQIEQMRSVLGNTVTDGLLQQAAKAAEVLRQRIDEATPGINTLKEAMRSLGVTSDAELNKVATSAKQAFDAMRASGEASARELSQGFAKAAQAAIDANKGVAPSWVQAEAAARGYTLQVDAAGKATLRLANASNQAAGGATAMASAIRQTSDAMELLLTRYKNSHQYSERQIELLSQEIDKRAALLDLREKEDALERRRKNVDKDGFTLDKNGNRQTMYAPSEESLFNQAKSAGLEDDEALQIAQSLMNRYRNMTNALTSGMTSSGIGPGSLFYDGKTFDVQAREAIFEAKKRQLSFGALAGVNSGRSQADSSAAAGARTPNTGGAARTYNVQVGNTTIRTVSDSDAQALLSVLRQARLSA